MRTIVGEFLYLLSVVVGAAGWFITHDTDFLVSFAAGLAFLLISAVESVERAVRANTAAQNKAIR